MVIINQKLVDRWVSVFTKMVFFFCLFFGEEDHLMLENKYYNWFFCWKMGVAKFLIL